MKTILYTIAIVTTTLTACTSVLDKNDLNSVSKEITWNNETLATAFLDKCYLDNMPVYDGNYARFCDESNGNSNFLQGLFSSPEQGSGPLKEYWPYNKIYNLNLLIKNIDNGNIDDNKRKELKGQALFLRAYQYFEMVKRYGGVPLILKPQDRYKDDLYVKRSNAADCIKQIIKDLDDAANSLPSKWDNDNYGRITKGAAMAFKGRVLMFYASKQFNPNNNISRWEDAYKANINARNELNANGFDLYNGDYSDIWLLENTCETIISTRFLDPVRTHNFMASIRPLEFSVQVTGNHHPSLDLILAYPMADGTKSGIDIDNDGIKEEFDVEAQDKRALFWINRDPRFYETIVYNGANYPLKGMPQWFEGHMFTYKGSEATTIPTATGFYSRKFSIPELSVNQAFNHGEMDFIEMRYAEVLLNIAECAAELTKQNETYTSEVYDILKSIRKRAGITANPNGMYGLETDMTKEKLIEAVLFEKRIELAFEGKRFWDLYRRKIFSDMAGYRREMVLIEKTDQYKDMTREEFIPLILNDPNFLGENYYKYFKTIKQNIDDVEPWNVKNNYYFLGLSRKHFEQNPNLEQTIGWENGTFDPLL